MAAQGRGLLASLGDDERTVRGKFHSVRVFASLRGLGEGIREQFVAIRLAVSIGIAEPPDPISVEDEQFFAANCDTQRFMQTGGETSPLDLFHLAGQPGDDPDIAVEGHGCGPAILKKSDIGKPKVSLPWIR